MYRVQRNGNHAGDFELLTEAQERFDRLVSKASANPSIDHYDETIELIELKMLRRQLVETPEGKRARASR